MPPLFTLTHVLRAQQMGELDPEAACPLFTALLHTYAHAHVLPHALARVLHTHVYL